MPSHAILFDLFCILLSGGTLQKANDSENEKNRAVTATLNAEIRRAKAELRNELPKLEKLANRKVLSDL